MMAVARTRVESAGQRNVTLTIGDARALCLRSDVFDAAFLSFTLELFESAIPQVLAEVQRVLRPGGRVGVVALAKESATNAMVDLYEWSIATGRMSSTARQSMSFVFSRWAVFAHKWPMPPPSGDFQSLLQSV
jgi:ubiquinone/menaquinone biosynthesis C-methylase UbiE